jgi:hypothetical protein
MGCSCLTSVHHRSIYVTECILFCRCNGKTIRLRPNERYLSRRLQMSALWDKALQSKCVVTHNDLHEFGESIQGRSLNSI